MSPALLLSATTPQKVQEADLLQLLEKAAVCAVLAPAGQQRQRIMGVLWRDQRIHSCSSAFMIAKM